MKTRSRTPNEHEHASTNTNWREAIERNEAYGYFSAAWQEEVTMAEWTLWATLFTLGTGMAILAIYLICRDRIEAVNNRIVALEKEMELARLREQANEKNLSKILDAVMELRESTGSQLENLRDRLNQLRADTYSQQSVDAA
jgi:hypothetical protein